MLLVLLDDLLDCDFSRQLGELVLSIDGVPVVDQMVLQFLRNQDSDFSFYDFLLSLVRHRRVKSLSLLLDDILIDRFV